MASSDSRGAVIALVGGLLGAVIGGGTSYATAQLSSSSENLRFTYTQERSAYVQVATAADALLSSSTRLLNTRSDEDPAAYAAAQPTVAADFLRLAQAYNEAFFVLARTAELVELYDAAVELQLDVPFDEFDVAAQDAGLDKYNERFIDFIEAAREQVRARLSETE